MLVKMMFYVPWAGGMWNMPPCFSTGLLSSLALCIHHNTWMLVQYDITLFFVLSFARVASLNLAAQNKQEKLLHLVDDGYRLDKLLAAASDERYRIIPPLWADLVVNSNHKPPLPVEGQAGRKKRRRETKRKRSNGEFATAEGATVSTSVAAAANAHAIAMSQGQSQAVGET